MHSTFSSFTRRLSSGVHAASSCARDVHRTTYNARRTVPHSQRAPLLNPVWRVCKAWASERGAQPRLCAPAHTSTCSTPVLRPGAFAWRWPGVRAQKAAMVHAEWMDKHRHVRGSIVEGGQGARGGGVGSSWRGQHRFAAPFGLLWLRCLHRFAPPRRLLGAAPKRPRQRPNKPRRR